MLQINRAAAKRYPAFLGLFMTEEDKTELMETARELGVSASDLGRTGIRLVLDQVKSQSANPQDH